MKHAIHILITALFVHSFAQAQVTDTVSVGAGYINQVWYSFSGDEQGSAPKNNWDLAFDVSPYGATVLANTVTGTKVWLYAAGDTSNWATLDTTGLSGWPNYYNSDTSWSAGAFNQGSASQYDMGWGIYSPITHFVNGDSLYIVKLSDNSYRKLWIMLLANGTYEFRYAHLDNSNDQSVSLVKTNYTGKNFAYYSMQTNAALDREPLSAGWDLLFTQYTSFLPQPYTVTGVLVNYGTTVAEAQGVDVNNVQWNSYPFTTPINGIGYDWKTLNMSTFQYDITDSLVYCVQTQNGEIWKMIFTGFGGSSNGNFIFSKELVDATGITDKSEASLMEIYPNPAGESATLTWNAAGASVILVTDITGKTVYVKQQNGNGLQQELLPAGNWQPGMYIVTLQTSGKTQCRKMIVR